MKKLDELTKTDKFKVLNYFELGNIKGGGPDDPPDSDDELPPPPPG